MKNKFRKLTEYRKKKFYEALTFAIDRLFLHDWHIQVVTKRLHGVLATTNIIPEGKIALIYLNVEDWHIDDDDVVDTGLHEACEIFFAQYKYYYDSICKQNKNKHIEEVLEIERHSLIQKLTKLLKYIQVLENKINKKDKRKK